MKVMFYFIILFEFMLLIFVVIHLNPKPRLTQNGLSIKTFMTADMWNTYCGHQAVHGVTHWIPTTLILYPFYSDEETERESERLGTFAQGGRVHSVQVGFNPATLTQSSSLNINTMSMGQF